MDKSTLFRNASTTYYYSSLFFPASVREDVFTLYAYVRKADVYVDVRPINARKFHQLVKDTWRCWDGNAIEDKIVAEFVSLCKRVNIHYSWVQAFLNTMENDLKIKTYASEKALDEYMYGSAEVIGLMMCAILSIPTSAYPYAQLQGKAMQLVNFIRDVAEDRSLGRSYIAADNTSLRRKIQHFYQLQEAAAKGYALIPYRYRIPIMTAAHLYLWTARTIEKDLSLVWRTKVKPHPVRVFFTFLRMSMQGMFV